MAHHSSGQSLTSSSSDSMRPRIPCLIPSVSMDLLSSTVLVDQGNPSRILQLHVLLTSKCALFSPFFPPRALASLEPLPDYRAYSTPF